MNEITTIANIYKQMRLDEAKCNKKMNESHYKIGDKVRCKASGMTGKVVKTDDPETGEYYSVETEKGVKKYSPDELEAITTEELDPVGKADDDIDNDGDVDSSDKYLKKRRKAISKSVKDDEKEDKIEEAVELAEASIDQTSKQIQQGVTALSKLIKHVGKGGIVERSLPNELKSDLKQIAGKLNEANGMMEDMLYELSQMNESVELEESKVDKKIDSAMNKLIIKMKKEKKKTSEILKALKINFPSYDTDKFYANFENEMAEGHVGEKQPTDVKDYPVKQQKSSKLKTILSKTKNKLEEARADYKRQISGSHKVKATVCYIDPMSRQRKCEDLFFKSKMDALGFKDNVKGFPKGAEVEAISEK